MDKWLVFVLAACTSAVACAQAAPLPREQEHDTQLIRLQKRLELRAAVSSASRRVERVPPLSDATPSGRQMTIQDHAEMREQLRRSQPAASRPHP